MKHVIHFQGFTLQKRVNKIMYLRTILSTVLFKVGAFEFDVRIHKRGVRHSGHNDSSTIYIHEIKAFRHFAPCNSHVTGPSGDRILYLAVVF